MFEYKKNNGKEKCLNIRSIMKKKSVCWKEKRRNSSVGKNGVNKKQFLSVALSVGKRDEQIFLHALRIPFSLAPSLSPSITSHHSCLSFSSYVQVHLFLSLTLSLPYPLSFSFPISPLPSLPYLLLTSFPLVTVQPLWDTTSSRARHLL